VLGDAEQLGGEQVIRVDRRVGTISTASKPASARVPACAMRNQSSTRARRARCGGAGDAVRHLQLRASAANTAWPRAAAARIIATELSLQGLRPASGSTTNSSFMRQPRFRSRSALVELDRSRQHRQPRDHP